MATFLTSSLGNCEKFTERSPLPLVASRPLMCVALKNGPRPRIVISVAPPFSRCDAAPVIDSRASPMESAGRSPMSSADKPSTTVVDSRLIEI